MAHEMEVPPVPGRCCLRKIGSRNTESGIGDILWLDSEINTIGRNKTSVDLYIDSSKYRALVSRLHARIVKIKSPIGNQYELYDTSLNGTFLNDIRINGSVLLKEGDVIAFGHVRGVTIAPGDYAPQPESELRYQFEEEPCIPDPQSPSTTKTSDPTTDYIDSPLEKTPKKAVTTSCFMTPPMTPGTPLSRCSNLKPKKRPFVGEDTVPTDEAKRNDAISDRICREGQFEKSCSSADCPNPELDIHVPSSQDSPAMDDDIFALVAKVSQNITKESEEDEYSFDLGPNVDMIDSTSTYKTGCFEQKEGRLSDSTTIEKLCSASSPHLDVYTLSTKKYSQGDKNHEKSDCGTAKDCPSLTVDDKKLRNLPSIQNADCEKPRSRQKERASSPECLNSFYVRGKRKRDTYYHEKCASSDCVHPSEDILTWVQCVDCLKWYHIKCVGLTEKEAKKKNNSYQCGC